MKQFNLDEYLKDPSQKVVTRDGRSVRIVCTNYIKRDFPVLALISSDGEEFAYSFSTGGEFSLDHTDDIDLFFADKEPTYRPYKDAEECFKDVIKHGGWIKAESTGCLSMIVEVYDSLAGVVACIMYKNINGKELLTEYTWADDGTPCGVKEE